ncbi:MAG TPA: hypothetical protein VGM62_14520, partial [Chthoniobacterales bacterium]
MAEAKKQKNTFFAWETVEILGWVANSAEGEFSFNPADFPIFAARLESFYQPFNYDVDGYHVDILLRFSEWPLLLLDAMKRPNQSCVRPVLT